MEFHFGYLGANYTWQEGRLRPVCSPIVLVLFSGYSETTGLSPAPQQGKLLCLPQLSPQIKLSLLSDFPLLYPASCGHCRPRHCGRLSPDSLNRSCCPQISKMSVSDHRHSSHDGILAYHWMIEAAAQWISFPLLSYYAGVTVISYPFIGFMNYHNCELALLLGLPVFHQRCQTSLPGNYGCYPESSLPLPPLPVAKAKRYFHFFVFLHNLLITSYNTFHDSLCSSLYLSNKDCFATQSFLLRVTPKSF